MGCCLKSHNQKRKEEILNKDLNFSVSRHSESPQKVLTEEIYKNSDPGSISMEIKPVTLKSSVVEFQEADSELFFSIRDAPDIPARLSEEELYYSLKTHGIEHFVEQTVDNFIWDQSENQSFLIKASLVLTGSLSVTEYIQELFLSFNEFIQKQAVIYYNENNKPLVYESFETPPGPLDKLWTIAISSPKYCEFCENLISRVIHRNDQGEPNYEVLPLYNFSPAEWETEKQTTLWVTFKELEQVFEILEESYNQEGLSEHDLVFKCKSKLNISKSVFRRSISGPKFHRFFSSSKESVPSVERQIIELVEPAFSKLKDEMTLELLASNNQIFVEEILEEYKRFLIMIYFSNKTLIPSSLVGYAWLLHQGESLNYHTLCANLFNKAVPYIESNIIGMNEILSLKEKYMDTLDFYRFIFQEEPDKTMWPDPHLRFTCENIPSLWISIFRIVRFMNEPKFNMKMYVERVLEEFCKRDPKVLEGKRGAERREMGDSFFIAKENVTESLVESDPKLTEPEIILNYAD